jgi:hydroxypyruvate isomerase
MRFSASVSLMFQEHALLDRFAAARDAGFGAVEIQRVDEGEPRAMAAAAARAGIPVLLINVGAGDYLEGGPGLSGVPGREAEFRAAFDRALQAAGLLGARFIHLAPSRVPEGVSRDACLATYRGNIAHALDRAGATGPTLLIEAMNRIEAPTALLNDVGDAGFLIRREFPGRIGLQFDIYHTAMNGRDVAAAFTAHLDLVRHVQFADAPGRHEPGAGHIDLPAVFRAIVGAGYDGWFGAEYRPTRETTATLGWMKRSPASGSGAP